MLITLSRQKTYEVVALFAFADKRILRLRKARVTDNLSASGSLYTARIFRESASRFFARRRLTLFRWVTDQARCF
jgi:hypothetical protein